MQEGGPVDENPPAPPKDQDVPPRVRKTQTTWMITWLMSLLDEMRIPHRAQTNIRFRLRCRNQFSFFRRHFCSWFSNGCTRTPSRGTPKILQLKLYRFTQTEFVFILKFIVAQSAQKSRLHQVSCSRIWWLLNVQMCYLNCYFWYAAFKVFLWM